MKQYFKLQYRMINRHLTEFGLPPLAGYVLMAMAFAGLSLYLFSKTEFAGYIYILAALAFPLKLCETVRNDFLKACFPDHSYYKVRIIENILVTIPFLAFLLYKMVLVPPAIIMILTILLAFLKIKNQLNITIPTPFYRKPFEFIVGFRNTFYLLLGAWFLAFMAITVGNFNLGIFSLILIFLISISFYSNPENEFFVWIYSLTPGEFLISKIKTALVFSTFLSVPVTIVLCIFFHSGIFVILSFQMLGYIYLTTMVLAKYSVFPNRMNLPQIAIIALSAGFPPLLLGIVPFFCVKAINRVKMLLND